METHYPGMNPYLEHPFYWHGFHTGLIACIGEELNAHLPDTYVARIEQRLVILGDDSQIMADGTVTEYVRRSDGSDAVAERAEPSGIAYRPSYGEYERFIEIRTIGKPGRVVAVIEVLSPSNKATGTQSWKDYRQKQQSLLCSDTHLLEIDLLRFGAYMNAAPIQALPPHDQWDYLASLYRAPDRFHFPYWLIKLTDRLPEVRVPLLEGDDDAFLDLQAAFDHAFRAGRYAQMIDYSEPPPAA